MDVLRGMAHLASGFIIVAAWVAPLAGQHSTLDTIHSMGQPPRLKPYIGTLVGLSTQFNPWRPGGLALVGVYRDLLEPIIGVGVAAEAYGGTFGHGLDGGVRVNVALPILFTQVGLDHAFNSGQTDFMLSVQAAVRRGGIAGRGSQLRLDWLPGRDQFIGFGITFPFAQGPMGRTRPRDTGVPVPKMGKHDRQPPPIGTTGLDTVGIAAALGEMREAHRWLLEVFGLYYTERGNTHAEALDSQRAAIRRFQVRASRIDALRPDGWTYNGEIAIWHREMARAFGLAVGAPATNAAATGEPIAVEARRALLDQVIIPYNALFGQHKDGDNLFGLGRKARVQFEAALDSRLVPANRRTTVLAIFDRLLRLLDDHRAALRRKHNGDTRFTWMPFQFVLRTEQYDNQWELDALIERVVGTGFTDSNGVAFVPGAQFQTALAAQLGAARRYHVLWIHDFRGVNSAGDPDSVSFFQTANYLRALTRAVRRYDTTGVMPTYLIFLDQHYYDRSKSRLWMTLLERPLDHQVLLSPKFDGFETRLRALQDSLRAAVVGSAGLQTAARAHGGVKWLRKIVKVHINITQPSDLSFRSRRLVLNIPFAPDNIARDHRKLAFFDVTERNPRAGRAIFTGTGVGEQYDDGTWDDRALVIKGPAVLGLKAQARLLLTRNGFTADEIPEPLGEAAGAPVPEEVPNQPYSGFWAHAMVVHNQVGFGVKRASVLQMMLITLMPSGSVIYIPDSIWTSMLYAAELVTAALRGCQVYLVAPSLANAPSAGSVTMALTWDVFSRLLEVQNGLQDEMQRHGGRLRVGFYHRKTPLDDVVGLLREVARGYDAQPFLSEEFHVRPEDFRWAADSLEREGFRPGAIIRDALKRAPKLHAKTQFFGTRATLDALARRGRGAGVLWAETVPTLQLQQALNIQGMPAGQELVAAKVNQVFASLPDSVRRTSLLYFSVGSLNKDTRSLLLDGEVNAVVGGPAALLGMLEFLHVFGVTVWPETQEQLNRLMPPWSERDRVLSFRLWKAI